MTNTQKYGGINKKGKYPGNRVLLFLILLLNQQICKLNLYEYKTTFANSFYHFFSDFEYQCATDFKRRTSVSNS